MSSGGYYADPGWGGRSKVLYKVYADEVSTFIPALLGIFVPPLTVGAGLAIQRDKTIILLMRDHLSEAEEPIVIREGLWQIIQPLGE